VLQGELPAPATNKEVISTTVRQFVLTLTGDAYVSHELPLMEIDSGFFLAVEPWEGSVFLSSMRLPNAFLFDCLVMNDVEKQPGLMVVVYLVGQCPQVVPVAGVRQVLQGDAPLLAMNMALVSNELRELASSLTRNDCLKDDLPLMEAGLDSLLAVEFRERLVSLLSVRLPSTFLFDHPTISDIERTLGAMV
jgi:hypothetical protein